MGGKHIPEGTKEAPDLSHKSDEHTNAGCLLREAVNRIGDHHGGDKLVSHSANGSANDGRDVPVSARRCLRADQEHNHTNDGQREAEITEPETELGLSLAVNTAGSTAHPEIGQHAAHLFANHGADDHTQELEAQLLGVQLELLLEQLRHFDGCQNAAEQEDHCICAGWDQDRGVAGHCKWTNELIPGEWCGIDSSQGHVLDLASGHAVHAATKVAGFGAKEQVQNELTAVDLLAC